MGIMSESEGNKILGLISGSNTAKIKRAYRQMAFKYHPDRNNNPGSHERFILIYQAYELLIQLEGGIRKDSPAGSAEETQDHYAQYMESRKQELEDLMDKARMKYQQFVGKDSAFRKKWYFIPGKLFAYLIFYLMIMLGGLIMGLPVLGLIYSGHYSFIILFVPLLIAGVIIIKYAYNYKIFIRPYFYD